jgi:hypothetical protein
MIEECQPEELDVKEIYWGEFYDVLSNKHLNNRLGRGFGAYDSDETKLKKSICHRGRINYWLKDKPLTEEHKSKISKSKTGNKQNRTKIRKDKGQIKTDHIDGVVKAKSKPIIQYGLEGNIIREWKSGKEAARVLGLNQPNINFCCNNKTSKYKGYVWKYKNEII